MMSTIRLRVRAWWRQFSTDKEDVVSDAESVQEAMDRMDEEIAQELFEVSDDLLDQIIDAADWCEVSILHMLWEVLKRFLWRKFDRY